MNSGKIMPHQLQQPLPKPPVHKPVKTEYKADFSSMLQDKLKEPLSLSRHAEKRMEERGIALTQETWDRMEDKVQEAKEKGVQDSVVLLDNAALVVSAENNKVITAMNREEADGQLFTNIDGAIVLT
ncbi:TIGR02530 family flagellar biosynthesis protein [Alkalicoccus chagannorensis]|uniref:TIGR02530 family flagellar biosynthesis protein n=1 Tax=Alkalicoccus chagannorensis TaxID=427072 RepID=UPI00041B06B1|nr:TIGR02530 family flagellar biosynthesis protein [Alkalicoccus chagannorensis]